MNNSLSQIDFNLDYEGYYWLSDASSPVLVPNKDKPFGSSIFEKPLPFVIEAYLFAKNENLSLTIRNVDGDYKVQVIDLGKIPAKRKIERTILGIQPEGEGHPLHFKLYEIWKEGPTVLELENMPELLPQTVAFAGFTHKTP